MKAQLRETVHETFQYAASYTPAGGGDSFDATVRLHRGVERLGTLEDGATISETVDKIVLLVSELEENDVASPAYGDEIEITGEGTFLVQVAEPAVDGTIVVVVVLDE